MTGEQPDARDAEGIDPLRRKLVLGARERWIRKLIDPGRRNNLLFYRDLKAGTLGLDAKPEILGQLLGKKWLELEQLVGDIEVPPHITDPAEREREQRELEKEGAAEVRHRLVTIQRTALSNLEEKGLDTLFAACGLAQWPAADEGRPYDAPVLLLPVHIESPGRVGEGIRLRLRGEPQANLVLLYILEHDFRIQIDPDDLLAAAATETEQGDWDFDLDRAYRFMEGRCQNVSGFRVRCRVVLGNFQFAKMAMVEDLRRHEEQLIGHTTISAIAGHGPSRRAFDSDEPDPPPTVLDEVPAAEDNLVLDADSSQHMAIRHVLEGRSGVIQGPPGTGKSQTIANLIAQLVSEGKRVLFVAAKRAALDAVLKRLNDPRVDLGHLVLDLHGASVSRKDVMGRIADALERIHGQPPVGGEELCRRFETRRKQLNEHAERVNRLREPAELSVYELQGRLLRMPSAARTQVRLRGRLLDEIDADRAHQIEEMLISAGALGELFTRTSNSPWNRAAVFTGEEAQAAIDLATRLAHELWPRLLQTLDDVLARAGLQRPNTLGEATDVASMIAATGSLLAVYDPELFDAELEATASALTPASRGLLRRMWSRLGNREYRAARRRLLATRSSRASSPQLLKDAQRALEMRRIWSQFGGAGKPYLPEGGSGYVETVKATTSLLQELARLLDAPALEQRSLDELGQWLTHVTGDARNAFRLPKVHELRSKLRDQGFSQLLQDIDESGVDPEFWPRRFRYAWLHSTLDKAMAEDQGLAAFDGRAHDRYVGEFVELDRKRLILAADRVRRQHAELAVASMNAHPNQTDLVRREAHKRSRHKPLRKLLTEAPDVLTRVVPCWVASPLSVSQLLDADQRHFDVTIFDEASQVPQEDAVPSILRADQLLVAGDRHQLPPTAFFASQLEEEEDEEQAGEAVEGFESVLDTVAAFMPNWMLMWHYRSEDERLIAFSNHHIYDDRLVTFPAALDREVISHELVAHDAGLSGQTVSSSPEVKRVVNLVIAHAREKSDETLGVITMGIRHANRLQAALDRELELFPGLSDFFSYEREERFFVKNLETVQGDERDAIILSIGYGKSSDGDLPHRFGPLTHKHGHRRLNVAVTRARRRMTVVSSFDHYEVDLERSGSRGVELLKYYLEYAQGGGEKLPLSAVSGEVPLNAFEADVKDALEARSIRILPQYGVSRYRIDLVATHPEKHGLPVLAIECDGASYHSSPTARDRDRLRQEHLMRLGWRFHRIWSTDWFHRREPEIERALAAYEDAVARSDLIASGDPQRPSVTNDISQSRKPQSSNSPERTAAPTLGRRDNITEYSRHELRKLAEWSMSDGLLRTDEDLMRIMLDQLGFARLGKRIRQRLSEAIRDARGEGGDSGSHLWVIR